MDEKDLLWSIQEQIAGVTGTNQSHIIEEPGLQPSYRIYKCFLYEGIGAVNPYDPWECENPRIFLFLSNGELHASLVHHNSLAYHNWNVSQRLEEPDFPERIIQQISSKFELTYKNDSE